MCNRHKPVLKHLRFFLVAYRPWIFSFFILVCLFTVLHQTQWSVEVKITKSSKETGRFAQTDHHTADGHLSTAAMLNTGNLLQTNTDIPFDSSQVAAFVKRFARVAKAEQTKFGLPASVSLAVSLMRSEAGTHKYAIEGCNYFGLKTDNGWPGAEFQSGGHHLRKYSSAWASWRDFSLTWYQIASNKKTEPAAALDILRHSGILTEAESVKARKIMQLYKLEEIDTLQF